MEYNFREIEKKWQRNWQETDAYKVSNDSDKPKYYVLDMFPYPSGAGLHVGHPLGYIASDIYARFKRLKGFNVLHPMGYDAFGLPAEQYAIEHGVHPEISTKKNIETFEKQLNNIGFCYDWSRKVNTSEPDYYKWTQWIFLQLFKSWFNRKTQKAEPISVLEEIFSKEGNKNHECPGDETVKFSAEEWNNFSEKEKQDILMNYRLAFCGYGEVNWCEALGTVLANDEVVNGVSERGGFPVEKKRLRQWYLRITEYADRLLKGLETVDFSDAMKEMQTNWIGKSTGAEIDFEIKSEKQKVKKLTVYTTRPDTIFGVDFMVVAPELDWIENIVSNEQKPKVEEYIAYVKSRSDRERQAEKKISGVFTGAYAVNPFNQKQIPIWISEYVLAGYGTGAIMAVPCGDERDFKFAQHFNIPITNILGDKFDGENANPTKDATLENSDFLNGIVMRDAIDIVVKKLEELGIGKRKVNYKMRDAAFSRQRYWGEPFPIVWKDGIAVPLDESELPLLLPKVDSYKPGPDVQGPLANIESWTAQHLETNTMPGYAGSSWYFLRYMDNKNEEEFCSRKASDYWNQVDVYVGGTEHAVGHLLYSRMWTKALHDLGFIDFDEPFKKLVNQGMIQGSSRFVYRKRDDPNKFISAELIIPDDYEEQKKKGIEFPTEPIYNKNEVSLIHVDVNIVDGEVLDIEAFKKWRNEEFKDATFQMNRVYNVLDKTKFTEKFYCISEVEKMSKSKFNTVNPDDLVEKFGADTFRMYEMFLGPVEQSKPWDTKGIEGVHRFLKKLWRLFYDDTKGQVWNDEKPTDADLKILHKTIQKIENDTERFSFNTAVSAFMVCVNELHDAKCFKKSVLEKLLIMLTPYAPHVSEELWHKLGNTNSILNAPFPVFEEKYIKESSKNYPVSINGKMRTNIAFPLDATEEQVREVVLQNEIVQKWLEGKPMKKFIFVKNKMINVVI
ncbi:leucine--tRNA ligase [Arachidicoccus ginsenosidimutans]|uniref:leucine--tRNA ligase n=1 Tax=Arachidicoccus sp. BS20 TaxID=1850526 RepID=UPI0007F0604A|nr:class I tRNA ligase family protein [Arachidicoccus sp. BS20]ANI88363.1 leucine--tRNA ligase [Arachidicoccus sp. BS20]